MQKPKVSSAARLAAPLIAPLAALLAATGACAAPPPAQGAVAPAASGAAFGESAARAVVDRWFALWSPGTDAFDWAALHALYSESGILVVDDFGGGITVIRTADDYVATWAPAMADGFTSWTFAPDTLAMQQSGELAVATFFATGNGVATDGERTRARQQGTLVLQYDPAEAEWEITQEQLTTLPGTEEAAAGNVAAGDTAAEETP